MTQIALKWLRAIPYCGRLLSLYEQTKKTKTCPTMRRRNVEKVSNQTGDVLTAYVVRSMPHHCQPGTATLLESFLDPDREQKSSQPCRYGRTMVSCKSRPTLQFWRSLYSHRNVRDIQLKKTKKIKNKKSKIQLFLNRSPIATNCDARVLDPGLGILARSVAVPGWQEEAAVPPSIYARILRHSASPHRSVIGASTTSSHCRHLAGTV